MLRRRTWPVSGLNGQLTTADSSSATKPHPAAQSPWAQGGGQARAWLWEGGQSWAGEQAGQILNGTEWAVGQQGPGSYLEVMTQSPLGLRIRSLQSSLLQRSPNRPLRAPLCRELTSRHGGAEGIHSPPSGHRTVAGGRDQGIQAPPGSPDPEGLTAEVALGDTTGEAALLQGLLDGRAETSTTSGGLQAQGQPSGPY